MCLLKISLCCHLFPLRPNKAPRSHHLQPLLLSGTWLFCLLSVCEMVWAHLGKPKYFYHKCRCLNSSKGLSTFQHICKKKKEKKRGWNGRKEAPSQPPSFCICSHHPIVTQALAPTFQIAPICCCNRCECFQAPWCAWIPATCPVPSLGDASSFLAVFQNQLDLPYACCIHWHRCGCQQCGQQQVNRCKYHRLGKPL